MTTLAGRRGPAAFGLVTLAALALIATACGGAQEAAPTTPTPSEAKIAPQVVTSELVVGPNRFAVGLVDEEAGAPVLGANVHFRFFKIEDGQSELQFEDDTEFVGFESFFIDDNTGEKVVTGDIGVYVSYVTFDAPGDWGVEVTGTVNGENFGPLRPGFTVLEAGQTLTVGDPAPRSRQRIASDVADISEIDSMSPSDPMHDITIADSIDVGKPVVVLFGTPAFCETRTCGPVMETVMLALYDKYNDQAIFIHVEPYFLKELREGAGLCAVPAFNLEFARQGIGEGPGPCPQLSEEELAAVGESWNLTTEPIVFVIDRQGNIAAKFEAIVGPQEVESVLQQTLASGGIGY